MPPESTTRWQQLAPTNPRSSSVPRTRFLTLNSRDTSSLLPSPPLPILLFFSRISFRATNNRERQIERDRGMEEEERNLSVDIGQVLPLFFPRGSSYPSLVRPPSRCSPTTYFATQTAGYKEPGVFMHIVDWRVDLCASVVLCVLSSTV